MSEPGKSRAWKSILAVALLLAGAVFVYMRYKSARPDLPAFGGAGSGAANAAGASDASSQALLDPESITPEQRRQFREEIYQQLDLTPDQRA